MAIWMWTTEDKGHDIQYDLKLKMFFMEVCMEDQAPQAPLTRLDITGTEI